jgi:hypothetical protein
VRGLAAKADNAGFQPGFELPGRQVEKNAEPVRRGASNIAWAASREDNGIESESARPRRPRQCAGHWRARTDPGYVSMSQHSIVAITLRRMERDRILSNRSNAGPQPPDGIARGRREGPAMIAGDHASDLETLRFALVRSAALEFHGGMRRMVNWNVAQRPAREKTLPGNLLHPNLPSIAPI